MQAADFKSRQELRAGELATIEKAIEIISSETVASAGEKHLPTLLQAKAKGHHSLAQAVNTQKNPLQ